MVRNAIAAMIFCPLPVMAAGVSFDEARVGNLRYGLVCGSDTSETLPAPDTAQGTIQKSEDWQKIIVETQMIPLTKGMALGVEASPVGPRNIEDVEIFVTHPPYADSGLVLDRWQTDFSAGGSNLNFFEFEYPYEMVEGQWTLEARSAGRVLYSVTFQVVSADALPEFAGLCDGISLTS